jgi:penicillin-binding protein 1A
MYRRIIVLLWVLFVFGVAGIYFVFHSAATGKFGEMPTFEQLENPESNLATHIYSSDSLLLGKFYLADNRSPVDYSELPKSLIDALVATEDARFFEHSGIDFRGFARAVVFLGKRGGASTISQQLARQLFVGVRSRNLKEALQQKIKEWVIAVRLERNYTKEEIIQMYLNNYDFNYLADGIENAARIYFNKTPQELEVKESAMLVGMLKNSSLYNPVRRPELVTSRRNTVLDQMVKYGYLEEKLSDSLQQTPLDIRFTPENSHNEGLATYFRMHLQSWLKNWVRENPKSTGETYDIYRDGLRVYTTIDSRLQENAEDAMESHLSNLQAAFFRQQKQDSNPTAPFIDLELEQVEEIVDRAMRNSDRWRSLRAQGKSDTLIKASFYVPAEMTVFDWKAPSKERDTVMTPYDSILYYKSHLRGALMSIEPQTGHIKAWVGGADYKHFQYDNVVQGARQVGSTFKPFVYAAAIDQLRMSPCDRLPDVPYCVSAGRHGNIEAWCPKNSGGKYSGESITLKHALANSINTVTAQLIDRVGPASVVSVAERLGIESRIPAVPAIALGTPDIKVFDLVSAYSTFANQGVHTTPTFVTRIEDESGNVIYEAIPETRDVFNKEIAYTMISLLKGVTEAGSGVRLRHNWMIDNPVYQEAVTGYPYEFKNPIAGKTGTTQNQSDGWFMGMVPNLATGVWVGAEDRAVHFDNITYGQGATMALPVWANYMRESYNDSIGVSSEDFIRPDQISINLLCNEANQVIREEKSEDLEEFDF